MGTRSRIGILRKDGSIESIYCNWDGYLEHVGNLLNNNYSNPKKIEELIKLGDILSLKEKINPDNNNKDDVTVAYHRDLKENWKYTKPLIHNNIDDFCKSLNNPIIEYIYLYDENKEKWLWDNVMYKIDETELKDLDTSLKEINMDIKI